MLGDVEKVYDFDSSQEVSLSSYVAKGLAEMERYLGIQATFTAYLASRADVG